MSTAVVLLATASVAQSAKGYGFLVTKSALLGAFFPVFRLSIAEAKVDPTTKMFLSAA